MEHVDKHFYGWIFCRQQLSSSNQRMEGVAIDPAGRQIALALSDSGTVQIYRRTTAGFEIQSAPQCVLPAAYSGLHYPHDVDFSPDGRLLAVADRHSMVLIFARRDIDGGYGPEPACEIAGETSGLTYTDGAAFVPPDGAILAACNLASNKITFYRRISSNAPRYENTPFYVLQGDGINEPDGLAFSNDGEYLAVANHGNHSVAIFRQRRHADQSDFAFDLDSIIADTTVRFSHSVAFTPRYNHLLLTNAGANYANIYRCQVQNDADVTWTDRPSQQLLVGDDEQFANVNTCNRMEGGPKGVALDRRTLAICRPETGLNLYAYSEYPEGIVLHSKPV